MILDSAVFDGHEYGFRFRWLDGALQPVLKNGRLRGRYVATKDHPYRTYWRYPRALIEDAEFFAGWAADLAAAAKIEASAAIQAFTEKLRDLPVTPNAFSRNLSQTLYPLSAGGFVVIGSEYHGAAAATLRGMGGTWLKEANGWHLPGAAPAMIVNNLVNAGYTEGQISVMDATYDLVGNRPKGAGLPTIKLPAASWLEANCSVKEEVGHGQIVAMVAHIRETGLDAAAIRAVIPAGLALPHQEEGAIFAATRSGCLIADDMGTGKTRTAIFAAFAARTTLPDRQGVIVAAPKSVVFKWGREIHAVYPNESVGVFDGDSPPDSCWIITNYERLDRLLDKAAGSSVLLIDEAHKLKEPDAIRTRMGSELASRIPYRYLLSATPILNRESEMHSLLRLTGHPLGDMQPTDFISRFSGSREFRGELNRILAREWMIRRLQSQVLRGRIPGKRHHYPSLRMSKRLATAYHEISHAPLNPLAKIHRIRRLLEEARVDVAREYARSIPADEKMIVFTEYVESAKKYAEALTTDRRRAVVVTGADASERARDDAFRALQEDDDVSFLVGTYGSCSEGQDGWRANHVFLASQPWVPGIRAQAEDRANRLGQTRLVEVLAPLYEETIDFDIQALLGEKSLIAQETLDPGELEREARQAISRRLAMH